MLMNHQVVLCGTRNVTLSTRKCLMSKMEQNHQQSSKLVLLLLSTQNQPTGIQSPQSLLVPCDQPAGSECLHEAATKQLGMKVWKYTHESEDTVLIATLNAGDIVAI